LPRWSHSCPERDRTHEFCTGIVDNIDGNTLAEALARLLGASAARGLAEAAARPPARAIAAAFFSPQGLANLARHIDGLERVWLLFGVEAPCDVELWRPNLGESPEHFEARLMREGSSTALAARTRACSCGLPAKRLDRLLNLEQRVLANIAIGAASIGVA
jgi:hypothetical protein